MLRLSRYRWFLYGTALCSVVPLVAVANPQGGSVSAGQATISSSGTTTAIHQSTDRAVIDWRGFDIAPNETTQFHQPSSGSITLNRVNSANPSSINGTLGANGNVIIVNPNGVFFGPTSHVDVNGLIATTADIDTTKFMAGSLAFDKPGNPQAAIENQGVITAKEAGLVGLVAPSVLNSGVISAKLGRVHLASGDTTTVDLYGDGLLEVAVGDGVTPQLVNNTGIIQAQGGTIALTAAAGAQMVRGVVHVAGELDAPSIGTKNGTIIIAAEGSNAVAGNIAANKGVKSGSSTVLVNGILNASGRNAGERGGSVRVTGDHVALLNGTLIDTSGESGVSGTTAGKALSAARPQAAGGDIQIGGDYLGGGTTPTASDLYVDPGVLVLNDALHDGDAGRSIFWADGTTQFYGNVYARALGGKHVDAITWDALGGGNAGDGGFVETSGHGHLDAGGYINLTSSAGARGTYFLDPTDITIYGHVDPSFTSTDGTVDLSDHLQIWLDSSDTANVVLNYRSIGTTASGTAGSHTVTVSATSDLGVGERLRLSAPGAITTADDFGADTYLITAINGNTVTVATPLARSYSSDYIYVAFVQQLIDKSGNGNYATQLTSGSQPLWLSNMQNGLAVTHFNGISNYLLFGSVPIGATSSIFATANFESHNDAVLLAGSTYTEGYAWYFAGGEAYTNWGAQYTNFGSDAPYPTMETAIYTGQNLGGHVANSYVNGALVGTETAVGTPTSSGVGSNGVLNNIGCLYQSGYCAFATFQGSLPELLVYNTAVSDTVRTLLEQYQSAKWDVALSPPGTGSSEMAKATAADGFSVFSTRYLERLSQSANVSLQATHDIQLDLQGDTLHFATAGRSLTLNAGNQITTASDGAISTTNGAISLTATNGILLHDAFTFNSGTAATTLTTTDSPISITHAFTLGGPTTLHAGTGTVTLDGTVDGARDLNVTAGSLVTNGAWGGVTPLANVALTLANSVNLPSIRANSIFAQTTAANADITIPLGATLSASGAGNAIVLASAQNFINGAATPFNLTGGGRFLIYSASPATDVLNGSTSDFIRYSCSYGGPCPSFASEPGNGFLYSYLQPVSPPPSTNPTVSMRPLTPSEYAAATHITAGEGIFNWADNTPIVSSENSEEDNLSIEFSPELRAILQKGV